MKIDLNRGMFRVFILLSVLWIISTAYCAVKYGNEMNASGLVIFVAFVIVGVLPPALIYMLGWTASGFRRETHQSPQS